MSNECVDLRQGDRFILTEPLTGTFGPAEVVVLNLSIGGMQLLHDHPLRIGTRGRIVFRAGQSVVSIAAHLIWSRAISESGHLSYHSGIQLDAPDASYALAIHGLVRRGIAQQDLDSLDKKRRRLAQREQQRIAQSKLRSIN